MATSATTTASYRVIAGDQIQITFTVTDAITGAPVPLTGTTPRFAIARGATVVVQTPTTATATITDAAGGIWRVTVAPSVTRTLAGTYTWQASIVDATGAVLTIAEGLLEIAPALLSPP